MQALLHDATCDHSVLSSRVTFVTNAPEHAGIGKCNFDHIGLPPCPYASSRRQRSHAEARSTPTERPSHTRYATIQEAAFQLRFVAGLPYGQADCDVLEKIILTPVRSVSESMSHNPLPTPVLDSCHTTLHSLPIARLVLLPSTSCLLEQDDRQASAFFARDKGFNVSRSEFRVRKAFRVPSPPQ